MHRKLRNDPDLFLKILKPYLPDVTVATESTGSWCWLGDLCQDEGRGLDEYPSHGNGRPRAIDPRRAAGMLYAGDVSRPR